MSINLDCIVWKVSVKKKVLKKNEKKHIAKRFTWTRLQPRWWCGGIAGSITQFIIAPLDLVETRMQVLQQNIGMINEFKISIKKQGFLSLYDGLSASILRQFTYTTLRFNLYETGKEYVNEQRFLDKACVAIVSGFLASFVGIPTDMINTRMQVDRALKKANQRRYKNVFDGLVRVCREEGFFTLYRGSQFAWTRGAVLTVGQNAIYDEANAFYGRYFRLNDKSKTLHLCSAITAALVCAPLAQPLDVMKTLAMQMETGYFKTFWDQFKYMTRFGILGFFRGFVPGTLRLVPYTVSLFFLYEQLRLNFGYYDDESLKTKLKH